MHQTVIIVAGGKGERMNSATPKQFLEIKSKPVLMHTMTNFYTWNKLIRLIVVLPETQLLNWELLCKKHAFNIPHQIVKGGVTRFESVKNGLSASDNEGIIAVHDGVRPLVSHQTISRCFTEAEKTGAVIPVMDAVESIRQILPDGSSLAVNRNEFKLVQTPQVFSAEILHRAYQQEYSSFFTDDASVVEAIGVKISLVEGNRENIKITSPEDLILAKTLL
jgi:2-C-methyl-D-erythritol 4-phosphate cytidylyltransferase